MGEQAYRFENTAQRSRLLPQEAADNVSQWNQATAKQAGFHSAANVEEAEEDPTEVEENVNLVLDAMEKSAEQINAVAMANAGFEQTIKGLEATITAQSKQITKLLEMNQSLVGMLAAAGLKPADKDKADAEEEKKNNGGGHRYRMCRYCEERHRGAGKGCMARNVNAHLRPSNYKGKTVDK